MSLRNKNINLSSLGLRIIGLAATLAGTIGIFRGRGYTWLANFSWFAFAIFAFLLTEGIEKSSDRVLYYRRFIIFTVLSEIAYDLFRIGRVWSPSRQSAMLTLLIGLVILGLLRSLREKLHNTVLDIAAILALGAGGWLLAERLNCLFGGKGILIILMFYVAGRVRYGKLLELAVLLFMAFYLSDVETLATVSLFGVQYPITNMFYVIAALIPIWLYKGRRKTYRMIVSIVCYAFFPVLLFILYLLRFVF